MKEDKKLSPFLDKYNEELLEHIEDIKEYLKVNNMEYKKLQEELEEIINNSENIQQIICNDKIKNVLTIEESKQFSRLIIIYNDMQRILEKEIYFRGGADAYDYFKKIGILK